jgi:hypothetical protein
MKENSKQDAFLQKGQYTRSSWCQCHSPLGGVELSYRS